MRTTNLQVLAVILAACFVGIESQTCTSNYDCVNINGVCNGGICQCAEGNVLVSNLKCLPYATDIGNGCDAKIQCIKLGDNVDCLNHYCTCDSEAYHDKTANRCMKKKKLGEPCTTVAECVVGPGSETAVYCTNQICSCPESYVPNKVNTECTINQQKLGGSCMIKEECFVDEGSEFKAECLEKKCACPADSKANKDANTCNSGVRNTLSVLSIVVLTAVAKMMS